MNNIKAKLKDQGILVENFMTNCLQDLNIPSRLQQAMSYSLLAGGKRLRPVLCLSTAGMCGLKVEDALPFACAIEMIHTYSLIHDDLPAMDNDDLRRGKPTCHKAFDEATAILAGDALLTDAFYFMLNSKLEASNVLQATLEVAKAAGGSGMVGGQMLDMQLTGAATCSLPELQAMQALKTGAMITAACTSGAMLGKASEQDIASVRSYGQFLGLAFQIIDDILDVTGDEVNMGKTMGKDAAQGKNTYPSLLGLEQSKTLAAQVSAKAVEALHNFTGQEADFLRGLVQVMLHRVS